MSSSDYLKPEFLTQQWTAFWSAWLLMLPTILGTFSLGWWLSGIRSAGKIGGLESEISFLERQLNEAVAKSATSDIAKDEVEKRLKLLEVAIAVKADSASLSTLASQVQSAVSELGRAQAAVSNAVTHRSWLDDSENWSIEWQQKELDKLKRAKDQKAQDH